MSAASQATDAWARQDYRDAEAWIARCTRHLMALKPGSPLDGTDWDDIAGDLHESLRRVPAEWAAATYVALIGA